MSEERMRAHMYSRGMNEKATTSRPQEVSSESGDFDDDSDDDDFLELDDDDENVRIFKLSYRYSRLCLMFPRIIKIKYVNSYVTNVYSQSLQTLGHYCCAGYFIRMERSSKTI